MEKSKKREWISALAEATIIALILYLLFWPFAIDGSSMENTFKTGDRVIVSRLCAYLNLIDYSDIVLCEANYQGKKEMIVKRIIGKPGDNIKISDNQVYINGVILTEPYIKEEASTAGNIDITLQEDEYFILGDNRHKSTDSRILGAIKKSDIEAKVIFKFYPFNEISCL